MYGKHFASMYTGSMFGSPALVFALWGYAIANMRPEKKTGRCTVELNPPMLAAMFTEPLDSVQRAIQRLCSPDPASRSQEAEGRKLIPVTDNAIGPALYIVINGPKYRAMRDEDERREYMRLAQQRFRERSKQGVKKVITVNQGQPLLTQAEAYSDTEGEEKISAPLRSALQTFPDQRETPEPSKDSETETREETVREKEEVPHNKPAGRNLFGGGLDKPARRDPSSFGIPRSPAEAPARTRGSNGHAGHGPRGPQVQTEAEEAAAPEDVQEPPEAEEPPEAGQDAAEPEESPEGGAVDNGAPVSDSAEERLARLMVVQAGALVGTAQERARKARTQQQRSHGIDARPAEKAPRKTKGKITREVMLKVRGLEERWGKEMKATFPDIVVATWAGKEIAQTAELLTKYGFEVTGLSFDYVVLNWEVIRTRSFKHIGGVPSVGFLLSRHEVLVAEAQQWTKIREYQVEYRAWRQGNRLAMVLPQALEQRRKTLQSAAKALGIDL